jgi:hypothetical protein
MNTAVLERPHRTQGFEESKPQVKENRPEVIYYSEIDFDTFDDWDSYDWELTEEGEKMLEEAFADLENGNLYTLATPKNWKE